MKIGIIGAGRIGGGLARQLAGAGHQLMLSFSRDEAKLAELAGQVGPDTRVGRPADAAAFGDVVVVSVPWSAIPEALAQAGPLTGKIVIDTTNQFGTPAPSGGQTAASFNAARMPGARYTKSFNTLTSGFQASAAGRAATSGSSSGYAVTLTPSKWLPGSSRTLGLSQSTLATRPTVQ